MFGLIVLLISGCCSNKPFSDKYDTHAALVSEIQSGSIHTIRAMEVDKKLNVYTAGNIFGTVKFGSETVSGPGHAGLLVKTNKDQQYKWNIKFGTTTGTSVCFMSEVLLSSKDTLFVAGYTNGNLVIDGKEYFKSTAKFQSFVAKIDTNRGIKSCRQIVDAGDDFLIMDIMRWGSTGFLGVGILQNNTTVLFSISEAGNFKVIKKIDDQSQIYSSSLVKAGSDVYISAIGTNFIHLYQFNHQLDSIWEFKQDTKADLLAIKSHLVSDLRRGIWLATTFGEGANDFMFGANIVKSTGLYDSYMAKFWNQKQVASIHIGGSGDQIVTGFFDVNKNYVSMALANSGDFIINKKTVSSQKGLSIIDFDIRKLEKIDVTTFPLENKERDRMTNSGLFFGKEKKSNLFFGGYFIKGETQTTDPKLTIGSEYLVAKNSTFNSFLIRATCKKKL